MVSAADVPADKLIKKTAEKLKSDDLMRPPKWVPFVKTGAHVEKKPVERDWWYTRCASILRKADVEGVIGVGRLRTWYGSRKNRGVKPEHHVDASGSIIRKAIQQLERAGYLKKEKAGRSLSPKGRSLLHKTALEVRKGGKADGRVGRAEAEKAPAAPERLPPASGAGADEKAANKPVAGPKGKGKAGKPKAGEPRAG